MEIQDIKTHLLITDVLTYYGLKPDRNNRIKCPWHDDKTPSLQIYPSTNTWTCFSSKCKAGSGDAIDMIMKMERCTKHEALIKATEMTGGASSKPKEEEITRSAVTEPSRSAILLKYYQGSLSSISHSVHGKAYAEKRNLDYNKLGIGYCSYEIGKTWSTDLQVGMEKLGLLKIRNCLIFATRTKENQIASIYGRCINPNPNVKHFFLQGGFKGLYPGYPKPDTKTIILVESIIDAATIKQYLPELGQTGTTYEVLALYGTNGFTTEHEEAIKSLPDLEEIILFFDGDEAGRAALVKYKESLPQIKPGIKISHVETPDDEEGNHPVRAGAGQQPGPGAGPGREQVRDRGGLNPRFFRSAGRLWQAGAQWHAVACGRVE